MPNIGLTSIELVNFRSYQHFTATNISKFVAVQGANGSGKTNLLEACSLLTHGKGLRQASARDITNWLNPNSSWAVKAELSTHQNAHLMAEYKNSRILRSFAENPLSSEEAHQFLQVFWHTPQMDHILCTPAAKRQLLDRSTARFIPEHLMHLAQYHHAIKERLNILQSSYFNAGDTLKVLEEKIAHHAENIILNRITCIDTLTPHLKEMSLNNVQTHISFTSDLDILWAQNPSVAKSQFLDALYNNRELEKKINRCRKGPHLTAINLSNIHSGACFENSSTGQKKLMTLLFLIGCIKATHKHQPCIFLLDETYSHLDSQSCQTLTNTLKNLQVQVWCTFLDNATPPASIGPSLQSLTIG